MVISQSNILPFSSLEVIGFLGQLGERDVPVVISPIFALKDDGMVLFPPYEKKGDFVQSASYMSRRKFCNLEEVFDESVTLLEAPFLADENKLLYADVGAGQVEYILLTECFERLKTFSNHHRILGDNYYHAGNLEGAIQEYGLTSSVSQSAEDYARLLLCGVSKQREEELRGFIQQLGSSPDELARMVKELLDK